ncbi:Uncharacterized conserved protein, DUF4415 family [Sphingomonas sp. YR710]|uniref:BrnA antitoxin family protein n=1 Tax=Sphingomonas sp. YR710 TaxID=1882773 RepID=UPI000880409D|nr:BrnA antitoxin family protein [Sphingomonas sp. YR710]SDD10636.1 Uncharacterized conserved protein, DUF4415 family [Sphingomonas sp. YR710]
MSENRPSSANGSGEEFDRDDAPELDDHFFDNAEVRIGDTVHRQATSTMKRRGRPPKGGGAKVQQSLRLPLEVIEAFKATGAGWHTQMEQALRQAAINLGTVDDAPMKLAQSLRERADATQGIVRAMQLQMASVQASIEAAGGAEFVKRSSEAAAEAMAKVEAIGGMDVISKSIDDARAAFARIEAAGGFTNLGKLQEAAQRVAKLSHR